MSDPCATGHTIVPIGCTFLPVRPATPGFLIKRHYPELYVFAMTATDTPRNSIATLNRFIAEKILPRMPAPGNWPTAIKGLMLYRRDWDYLSENCFYPPAITAVIQGQRNSFLGDREYHYEEGDCLVHSVEVPSVNYFTKASPEKPFLSVSLEVDRYLAARFAREIAPDGTITPMPETSENISVADIDIDVLDAFARLVALLDKPEYIPHLAPLIIEEIHCRMLMGHQGKLLRQVNTAGTRGNQIARAVSWLREHYREPLHIDDLARQVNMAPSTFFRHFREITLLSPLQYQKQLRLHEAQRLMLVEKQYVSSAALAVGYENVKQFSREYKRFFGEPPSRDALKARKTFFSPNGSSGISG